MIHTPQPNSDLAQLVEQENDIYIYIYIYIYHIYIFYIYIYHYIYYAQKDVIKLRCRRIALYTGLSYQMINGFLM